MRDADSAALMVPLPTLQAIVDAGAAAARGWPPLDLARAYLEGGARFLQVRAKGLTSGPFLDLCDAVVAAAEPMRAIVIVNDRVDLAKMSGASGAHVGQDDLPVAATRALLGPDAVIGHSTHSTAQIHAALTQPSSYIAVGPVFGTRTKDTGYEAVGLDLVREAARLCGGRPVVAIGGITLETAPSVLEAGAACVAVIGDLLATGDPESRVREYCAQLR
jgi:thiamine-phosphate pyrophosphorylase